MNFTFNNTNIINNDPETCQQLLDQQIGIITNLNNELIIKAQISILILFIIFNIYLYAYGRNKKLKPIHYKILDGMIIPYYAITGFLIAFLFFFIK